MQEQTQNHNQKKNKVELPPIPNKRYFTIGEVSELCQLKAHVLRYWEQEFSQLKPNKRRGNRRYYQYKDVVMIRKIRQLLYEEGFTISGARHQLQQSVQEKQTRFDVFQLIKEMIQDLESTLSILTSE